MEDARLLERTHEDLANDVALIAAEFLSGFQKVLEINRPPASTRSPSRTATPARRGDSSPKPASPSSRAAAPA